MDSKTISKTKEQEEDLRGKQSYKMFFLVYFSLHTLNYAFDYKFIYKPQVLNKQWIKLLKENSNLNSKYILLT